MKNRSCIKTHPGEVLKEEFMEPLGLSANALAKAIGVPQNCVSDIARERHSVSADTALRLAKYFGTTEKFWTNLQDNHDLSKAMIESRTAIQRIKQHPDIDVRLST